MFQNPEQSSREPRLQKQDTSVNIISDRVDTKQEEEVVKEDFAQRTEVLRNIDEELLDRLSPQPSILSSSILGLSSTHSADDNKHAGDLIQTFDF